MELFVTEEQLRTVASLSSSIEPAFLTPYLKVAQDMAVVPLIGIALATELSNQLLSGTTTPANDALLAVILPFQAYKSWELASPFLGMKAYKKSLVKPVDPNSEALSLDEMKFYKANITGLVNFYQEQLYDMLEDDAALAVPVYPLYRSTQTNEFRSTGTPTSGFFFKTKTNRNDCDYH